MYAYQARTRSALPASNVGSQQAPQLTVCVQEQELKALLCHAPVLCRCTLRLLSVQAYSVLQWLCHKIRVQQNGEGAAFGITGQTCLHTVIHLQNPPPDAMPCAAEGLHLLHLQLIFLQT